jgi:hypothetical protein
VVCKISWGNATYEKFAALKNHLHDFDENLSFEGLNESHLMDYQLSAWNFKYAKCFRLVEEGIEKNII